MDKTMAIIAVVFVWLVILMFILMVIVGRIKKGLAMKLEKRFAGQNIILHQMGAKFFGQKSKGLIQMRGNGALVLNKDELWFLMAVPERQVSIPLKNIKKVTLPVSHLGKTVFRPLLCVEFSSDGLDDSIAWAVPDPEKWKEAIEEAAGI